MVGYLDEVRNGEARGWVVDPLHPTTPVAITVLVQRKPVADAIALYQRADVGEAMGTQGYSGYFMACRPVPTGATTPPSK